MANTAAYLTDDLLPDGSVFYRLRHMFYDGTKALGNGKTALRIFRNVFILDPQNLEARNRVKAAETAGDRSS